MTDTIPEDCYRAAVAAYVDADEGMGSPASVRAAVGVAYRMARGDAAAAVVAIADDEASRPARDERSRWLEEHLREAAQAAAGGFAVAGLVGELLRLHENVGGYCSECSGGTWGDQRAFPCATVAALVRRA